MTEKRDPAWVVVLILFLLVAAFVSFAMIQPWLTGRGMMGGWGMGPWMMGFGFGWSFMFLVPLGFVALVVLGIYYLFSRQAGVQGAFAHTESGALRILKERYARGEIASDQYSKMKRDIES